MSIKDELIYAVAIFAGLVLVIGLLGGCVAHRPHPLNISCFANADSTKTKPAEEGMGPLMIVEGQVFYYNEDGTLHRVKEAVCGVR